MVFFVNKYASYVFLIAFCFSDASLVHCNVNDCDERLNKDHIMQRVRDGNDITEKKLEFLSSAAWVKAGVSISLGAISFLLSMVIPNNSYYARTGCVCLYVLGGLFGGGAVGFVIDTRLQNKCLKEFQADRQKQEKGIKHLVAKSNKNCVVEKY